MEERKLTGYPSIDRPWLKYYSEEALIAPLPEGTIYAYLLDNNRSHLDDIALNYFGKQITYGKLFEEIEKTAMAFNSLGIKQGDIVSIISIATPEVIYSFYALNLIGAVSNWIDLRKPASEILDITKSCHSRVCLVFDEADPHLCPTLLSAGCQCVTVSVSDTLPFPLNVLYRAKKAKRRAGAVEGVRSWSDFISGSKSGEVPALSHAGDALALLEYTGGTTGVSKAVMLTNKNVNSVVAQYRMGGTDWQRGDHWLSVGFPFIAYSLICSIHLPLSLGITGVLCFDLDVEKVKRLVQKSKCNHMSNTPITWEALISEADERIDYSFLKNPVVGADTLLPAKENEINTFLKQHGAKCEIAKGYGMTEVGSAVSVCAPAYNRLGSVGIPFLNTTISIFDPDTGDELPYDQQGEICISGPSVMRGYFGHPEETEKVLKQHKDGKLWMHSGDLGHMDADGFLFIDGRIKRMLIDHIGFKTFAPQVEQVLSQCVCVEKCCVVGAPDPYHSVGQIPVAYAVVKGDEKAAITEMKQACGAALPEHSVPARFVPVKALLYTPAGKVDYRALERMAADAPQS